MQLHTMHHSTLLRRRATLPRKASKLPFLNQTIPVVGDVADVNMPFLTLTDVTEVIGSGKVDMGFKAMIHTLAVSNDG